MDMDGLMDRSTYSIKINQIHSNTIKCLKMLMFSSRKLDMASEHEMLPLRERLTATRSISLIPVTGRSGMPASHFSDTHRMPGKIDQR